MDHPLDKRIIKTIRLAESDVEFVETIAKARGMSFTDVIRELVRIARRNPQFEPHRETVNWLRP